MSDQVPTSVDAEVSERFDPARMRGEIIEAEHLARYRWVSPIAADRRVLDAGCGTAYGSMLLAEAGALEVVGVDLATGVLEEAREQMPATVVLEEGDVTSLAYEDASFDLVVCFEVIEHLEEPGRALDEFHRVLGPDGVLAVSSPNRDVYPPGNPHHVHEYTPPELERELARNFPFVRLERQHTWITSGVFDDARFEIGDDEDLGADVGIRKLVADEPGAELYTLALASRREPPSPAATLELATAVEVRKWDALWHEQDEVLGRQADLFVAHEQLFAEKAAEGSRLWDEVQELRRQLEATESELSRMPALDAQLQELIAINDELLALNHELQRRQETLEELQATAARYAVLVESRSWKLTGPLRHAGALARKLAR
jgi:O-antigen biosynthesis protein